MCRINQLLLYACCLFILISMVCLLKEEPYISKAEIIKAFS